MSKAIIRNKASKIIGYIRTDSKGKQTAYNVNDEKIGHFDPKVNKTKDRKGIIIGHGNLLMSLILIAS